MRPSELDFRHYEPRVMLRVVIGSRAYGLDDEHSDTDKRGIYLPQAEQHWSLEGVPEQIENDATQEVYWELEKFLKLALKSNPNILETLYSPLVEFASPFAKKLIAARAEFLSRAVYDTFQGYVESQFKRITTELRNLERIRWKQMMHLIRLQLTGITLLQTGELTLHVGEHLQLLRDIKSGKRKFDEVDALRRSLSHQFDLALATTSLPEHPNRELANDLLIEARTLALQASLP